METRSNLAQRLEALSAQLNTSVLADENVRNAASDGFEWRTVHGVTIKGKIVSVRVFELLRASSGASLTSKQDLHIRRPGKSIRVPLNARALLLLHVRFRCRFEAELFVPDVSTRVRNIAANAQGARGQ